MIPFTFNLIFRFNRTIRLVFEILLSVVFDTPVDLFIPNLLIEVVHLLFCQSIHLAIQTDV